MALKRLIALMFSLGLGLAGAAMPTAADVPAAAPQAAPKPSRDYRCPPTATINCMPPIGDDRRELCSKDYLAWAQAHCPNVQVVY